MKFIIDMNLSPDWVAALGSVGYEAAHWSTVGAPDADDITIAEFARENEWVIVTNDLDFGGSRPVAQCVIQIRLGDLRPVTLLEALRKTIEVTMSDLENEALVTMGTSKVRISALPLADGAP